MKKIFMIRKLKWQTWAGILILLAFSAAFSLTVWVFSLYTLLHWQKVLVFGFLFVTLGLFLLRYVQPELEKVRFRKKEFFTFVLGGISGLLIVFNLVNYHKAPIRTMHELILTNISEQKDITLDYIQLPGDVWVDLLVEYPDYEFYEEAVILPPGQSLTYTREMVGGMEISVSASYYGDASSPYLRMIWDGEEEETYVHMRGTNYTKIELPGWQWGSPSLVYRALGILNIATDCLALVLLSFCSQGIFTKHKVIANADPEFPLFNALKAYSIPILISFGLTILALLNQLWITKNISFSLILMLVGVTSFIPTFFAQHRKWIFRAALPLILLGILFNLYVFISPINELHLSPEILTDNSFAKLAQKAGDSTYLSMGYYRYFRNATLHIPADLMAELNLFTDRLERMNTGLQVRDALYDYQLAAEVADQWLEDYDWQAWPREVGGTFYLSLDETNPGDELYFFQSGDRYFLVSVDFLLESGMTDVSILN